MQIKKLAQNLFKEIAASASLPRNDKNRQQCRLLVIARERSGRGNLLTLK